MLLPALVGTLLSSHAIAQQDSAVPVDWRGITFAEPRDRLPNFSFAGAYASEQGLPSPLEQADITLQSTNSSHDRTSDIQDALDKLRRSGGGILQLSAGEFNISSDSIVVQGVGVTLRGELLSEPGASLSTVIKVSGKARTPLVIGGPNADAIVYRNGTQTPITNNYVGVGASSFDVREPGKFKKGDRVEIQRIISEKWIAAEEMDGLRRDGENQTWIAPGEVYAQRRKITAISNHTIQIDFPLTDPLNAQLNASGTLIAYDLPDNYTHSCSIESIDIELEDDQTGAPINADDNFPQAVSFSRWSRDNWIRQLSISGFVSAVHVEKDASRITMQDVNVWRELKTNSSAGYPADFLIDGTQTLLHRCSTAGVESSESFTVATGAMVAGPNVALEHATSSDRHMIEPHARWATGVLVDDSLIGSLSLVNRGSYGSGHGWACAFSLGWNVISFGVMNVESPPLSANLCVGCMGAVNTDQANYTSFIEPQRQVWPPSLFKAQLAARVGNDVAESVLSNPVTKSSSPDDSSSITLPNASSSSAPSSTRYTTDSNGHITVGDPSSTASVSVSSGRKELHSIWSSAVLCIPMVIIRMLL